MIRKYESFKTFNDANLNLGDKVVVKYRDSKFFMQIGTITSINSKLGDCTISMNFSDDTVVLYYTNFVKVIELIEVPSGEVLYVPEPDAMDLAMVGLIKHNKRPDFYFFEEADRWQIEDYAIC